MTLEHLAEASGVSARAISDMERGYSRAPQQRTLVAIVGALELPATDQEALLDAARSARTRGGDGSAGMPRSVADFVGRRPELELLDKHASQRGGPTPVALIHGPPGLGKSTLAIWAAEQLRDRYPDGQIFLDLRGMDAEPLPPADALTRLLRALGFSPRHIAEDADERATQLRAALHGRRCLVILDNAANEAQLRPLLPGTGDGLVLITSRRTLSGLDGVLRLPLGPLSAAESAYLLRAISGPRAHAVPDADPVAEVARLCGFMPLALRIAGNRLVSRPGWTMAQLASRLFHGDRRLATLTSGDLGVEAAFGLSYAQLSDAARQAFRRLSLIPGGDFGVDLAAVVADASVADTEDLLDELVDLGLLQTSPPDRLRFHDLIRLYAEGRLNTEEPDTERLAGQARMVSWLLDTAVVAGRWFEPGYGALPQGWQGLVALDNPDQAQAWLRTELDNWLAALRTAAQEGQHLRVVSVAEAMHWFSDRALHWIDWTDVYLLSREAARYVPDRSVEVTHMNYLAWALYRCAGRHRESAALAQEAYDLAGEIGDVAQQGWAMMYADQAYRRLNAIASADAALSRAAPLFDAAGDHAGYCMALLATGQALSARGCPAEAVEVYQATLEAARTRPVAPGVRLATTARALTLLTRALGVLGRWAEAAETGTAALPALEEYTEPVMHGEGLLWLAWAEHALGRTQDARAHLAKALDLFATAEHDGYLRETTEALAALDEAG